MKRLRMLLVAGIISIGAITPIASALATMQPSQSTVVRIADDPTPTPTPTPSGPGGGYDGGGGCTNGCPG